MTIFYFGNVLKIFCNCKSFCNQVS